MADLSPTPRSIVELIRAGVLDADLAATLWVLIEGRVPIIVAATETAWTHPPGRVRGGT